MGPAGDLTYGLAVNKDRIAVTRDQGPQHLETGQPSRDAGFHLTQKGLTSSEVSLFKFHDPSYTRFDGRCRLIHIVPMKQQSRFQAKRVTGAQTDRQNAERRSRVNERSPNRVGI